MKLRRIHIAPEDIDDDYVRLTADHRNYLERVLRLSAGNRIIVCDGSSEHVAVLIRDRQKKLAARIKNTTERNPSDLPRIVLGFGCVRPGPLEEILRHGTELGATVFVPLITARVVRRPESKKDRWDGITASAAQQCGRVDLPEVYPPTTLHGFIAERSEDELKIACTQHGHPPSTSVLRPACSAVVAVGPEGGLEEAEEKLLLSAGFLPVSLGPWTLRTETAAILAAGLLSALADTSRNEHEERADEHL
jgi:16S rRNA (uracil1498-N3)-methyltransferase